MNKSLEYLEAELHALGAVITDEDKTRKEHVLFVVIKPSENCPAVTYVCTWLETLVDDETVYFRAGGTGNSGYYVTFNAKMVKSLKTTISSKNNAPAHQIHLGSSEAWQND